jgi:hypothetical protein
MTDPALTDALTDTEARFLLAWALGKVTYLVDQTEGLDDETSAELLASPMKALRIHIRWLARVSAADPDPLATLQWLLTPMTN